MKLRLVPASAGAQWVKQGLRTFFRQPLALSGMFLMFVMPVSVLGLIPWVGVLLQTVLLPAGILGMMMATQEADQGRFPMPKLMLTAFTGGARRARAMLLLGVCWALAVLAMLGICTLIDGGEFARHYLAGQPISQEMTQEPRYQIGLLVALVLNLVMTAMLWHSPGLTYFGELPPMKCFFFSLVASIKNIGAYVVYSLLMSAVLMVGLMAAAILLLLTGGETWVKAGLAPLIMLVVAMTFTSIYFTFRDSFDMGSSTEQ